MIKGVEESYCSTCTHSNVCKFKETYMLAVGAINNASITNEKSGTVSIQEIKNINFIKIEKPRCLYYEKRKIENVRSEL